MRSVVLSGAAGALFLGLTTGVALRPHDGDQSDTPKGPQLVYSGERTYGPERPSEGWWSVGTGPIGDWVFGTRWTHPEVESAYSPSLAEASPPEEQPAPVPALGLASASIGPTTYAVPRADEGVRDARVSVWRPQPAANDGGERGEVGLAYYERRRQVDDLPHRPDPGAQFGEARTERPSLDRGVELDHADRAQYPDVDDAG